MNAIRLGDPNLFVKGIAEVTIYDYKSGDIIGFDKVASEGSITSSVNMGEVVGGIGSPLLMTIPDTTRITGSLTSQAFSMEQRALASGGEVTYGGITQVCEHITANGASLTVSGQPVKHYSQSAEDTTGWCHIRVHQGGSYMGTNYEVDLSTKKVLNFVAELGKEYDVFYFINNASAKVLELPSNFKPSVAALSYKFEVYAQQNGSVGNGTRVGFLYFHVMRAQFGGDVGISANQTTAANTDYSWNALAAVDNMPTCNGCDEDGSPYAYYVYVPCGAADQGVDALAVVGGAVTVKVNGTAQIPVKYVVNNHLVQPTYADLTFTVDSDTTATVEKGLVTGKLAGETEVEISYVKKDGTTLKTTCTVVVS